VGAHLAFTNTPRQALRFAVAPTYDARGTMEQGTVLAGKYRIGHVLGHGGMGMVTFAHHLQLKQPVAIKFLHPFVGHDADAVKRLLREAQAAARLRSEHVARVLDVGAIGNGTPFIVMEHLEGQDVSSLLRAGPVSPAAAVDIVVQACEALAEAHALGIVHRDLKPSNLFVTRRPDGSTLVKVLDFGISKTTVEADGAPVVEAPVSPGDAIDTERSGDDMNATAVVVPLPTPGVAIEPASTRTEVVMGTPGYMSPEHMRSSKHVDARTDVWSIGVVLYELLSGRRPFRAETRLVLRALVETAPLPPLPSSVPTGLARAVARCLEKDPADRFQDVASLTSALAPFAPVPDEVHAAASRMMRVLGTSRPGTDLEVGYEMRPARPRRSWRAAAAAVLAAGVTAAIALGGRSPAPRSEPVPAVPPPVVVPAVQVPAAAPPPVFGPAARVAPPRREGKNPSPARKPPNRPSGPTVRPEQEARKTAPQSDLDRALETRE
jgi:serine/threonine protein kinase